MKITVTKEHALKAVQESYRNVPICCRCAVYWAAKELMPKSEIAVGYLQLYVDNKPFRPIDEDKMAGLTEIKSIEMKRMGVEAFKSVEFPVEIEFRGIN